MDIITCKVEGRQYCGNPATHAVWEGSTDWPAINTCDSCLTHAIKVATASNLRFGDRSGIISVGAF